jgi:hypothetical protein
VGPGTVISASVSSRHSCTTCAWLSTMYLASAPLAQDSADCPGGHTLSMIMPNSTWTHMTTISRGTQARTRSSSTQSSYQSWQATWLQLNDTTASQGTAYSCHVSCAWLATARWRYSNKRGGSQTTQHPLCLVQRTARTCRGGCLTEGAPSSWALPLKLSSVAGLMAPARCPAAPTSCACNAASSAGGG